MWSLINGNLDDENELLEDTKKEKKRKGADGSSRTDGYSSVREISTYDHYTHDSYISRGVILHMTPLPF